MIRRLLCRLGAHSPERGVSRHYWWTCAHCSRLFIGKGKRP